jgi:hypothetical protein
MNEPLLGTAGGALGGALGTLFMTQSYKLAPHLPESVQPIPLRRDPGDFLVNKVESLAHRRAGEPVERAAAKGLQWSYGIGWGALLGLVGARLEASHLSRALIAGATLGTLVYAAGYAGWIPALGLSEPIYRQPAGRIASGWLSHVIYGVLVALPVFGLLAWNERLSSRRGLFARRLRARSFSPRVRARRFVRRVRARRFINRVGEIVSAF